MSAPSASLPLRVYGLEGVTKTQDEAITRQGVTLAEHDERLGKHDTELAVHGTMLIGNAKQISDLASLMTKVIWSLVGLSTAITVAAVTVALTVSAGG